MITLKLQIENPSILTPLKEVLKAMNGVKVIDPANEQSVQENDEETPNAVTLAAMKEVESGKDAGTVSIKDMESFIASMQ